MNAPGKPGHSLWNTQALLTMEEGLFYQLLDGPGTMQIDIIKLDDYFAPFVSFYAGGGAPCVQHGAIVRGRSDLLAAETVDGVLVLLRDIAGGSRSLKIIFPLGFERHDTLHRACGVRENAHQSAIEVLQSSIK